MENQRVVLVIGSLLLVSLIVNIGNAQLSTGFYKNICPNVESLVRAAVTKKFHETTVTAPATLRLFFHDCFVQGCDASVILASPNNDAEKDHPDDLSLAGDGFDTVIKAKEAVDRDAKCKNKVSCADILALAARDVIALTGGPSYSVELGRRDGRISTMSSVNRSLPHSDFTLHKLNTLFSSNGLNKIDVIALSGAHTMGFSHCKHFSKRIYNFTSNTSIDPTLNSTYALQLRQLCPKNVDPRVAIPMDPTSPLIFDNAYFKNLKQGKGLFTSDQALLGNNKSRATIDLFASSNSAFNQALVSAMTKLGRVGVKTGNQGEIRRICSAVN